MKKFSALIVAALLAMTISMPVLAEPDDDTLDEDISVSVTDEETPDTEEQSANDTLSDEDSETNDSSIDDAIQKKVPSETYMIPEVGMYIDFPEDMYVLTRTMDAKSPVLKTYKMTKDEVLENFKETNTYLKASAADFSYDVTVSLLKNDDTKTIENLAVLKDADIQSIVNNILQQSLYTGCSRMKYNNLLYLSFPMEFEAENTKVKGIQNYTIVNGCRLVISFQSYTGETDTNFNRFVTTVMNSITFDGISPEPQEVSVSVQSSQEDLKTDGMDVRYVYLLMTSLVAIIFLTLIIVTAMKYHKSKNESKSSSAPQENTPEKTDSDKSARKIEITNAQLTEMTETPKEKTAAAPEEVSPSEPETATKTEIEPKTVPETESPAADSETVTEEPSTAPVETSSDNEATHALPDSNNQLEIVEIAFRIIPFLKSETEDNTEIWNFIDKKMADMEFFAAHTPQSSSNANAFYRFNAGSNLGTPAAAVQNTAQTSTIDDEIRKETLETVVGDSKPEMLRFDKETVSADAEPSETESEQHDNVPAETESEQSLQPSPNEIYRNDEQSADTENTASSDQQKQS